MEGNQTTVFKRKLPSQARSQRTVDLLLDATAQILESQGEEALTTTAVAEHAGYSIGTLYQYFGSRDALLIALAERERKRIAKSLIAFFDKLDPEGSPDLMREIVRELIQSFARRRGARRQFALLALHMASREDQKTSFDDFSEILIGAWQRFGFDKGASLDKADAYVLTRAVQGVLRGAVLERSSPIDEESFEDALLLLITSFMTAHRHRTTRHGAA